MPVVVLVFVLCLGQRAGSRLVSGDKLKLSLETSAANESPVTFLWAGRFSAPNAPEICGASVTASCKPPGQRTLQTALTPGTIIPPFFHVPDVYNHI